MNIESIEKVLIVIDMINGFVREGEMADKEIEHIIPEIKKQVDNFVKENQGIIFVKDCHEKNSIEFLSFPEHCIKGTTEAELVEELKPYENKALKVFEKNSTSAIFAENFIKTIDSMKNLKQVMLVGCCTDICVLNLAIPLKNYFNEKNRKIEIIVPKNAVETYNSNIHNREEYNEIAYKLLNMSGINLK